MTRQRVIAVLLAPRKLAKLPLVDICLAADCLLITLTKENWKSTLQSGQVIDVLVHKLADFTVDSQGEGRAPFEGYRETVSLSIKNGTILKVVDSFEGMDMLQNRVSMLRTMDALIEGLPLVVPKWSNCPLKEMFVIAKPVDACSAPNSHVMQLITPFSTEDLKIVNHVFQTFIPHHETLYKLYVIGKHVEVVIRSSISASIFSSHGEFEYGVTVGKAQVLDLSALKIAKDRLSPHMPALIQFIDRMRKAYNLTLFGVDVLLSEDPTNTPHIIDVNYFPGFDGVSSLAHKLIDALIN
jgi:Inositol 1,3,4-trisphosphate 5/6-kinase ATP-grasp domain